MNESNTRKRGGHRKNSFRRRTHPDTKHPYEGKKNLKQLAEDMDRDCMGCGKLCAELYRCLTRAAVLLPEMSLHTKLLSVDNSKDSLTVTFHRGWVEKASRSLYSGCNGCRGDCPDDEEERVYDEY